MTALADTGYIIADVDQNAGILIDNQASRCFDVEAVVMDNITLNVPGGC